ncbi:MAG TPA: glycosyltransferase family 1 protein [Candidatus Polarisedimenticolaceae bacterium]|nr:glycosyltransferase family 1 protein [Candidatus Polarisedimenticolaceae bacterium]
MRILLDLRCLETGSAVRGLGRHTRELARAVRAQAPPAVRVAGLSFQGEVARALGLEDVRYPGPRRGITLSDRWLLPRLLRHEQVDLYHAPAFGVPPGGARETALVLTVHDLIPEILPKSVPLRARAAFRRIHRSARAAHRVIAVSETTRRDLLAHYPVPADRVVVVPNGVAAPFAGVRPGPGRSGDPFILYVGGLDPTKNVPFLLDVLAEVRRQVPTMRLALAGETGPRREALAARARAAGLEEAVDLLGFLDDGRLAAAYQEAAAFVFPSLYEGFGLPPLEAMAAGCPVVASPGGALPEVLGDAAWIAPLGDAGTWANAIVTVHRDIGRRRVLVDAGRAHAARYSWDRVGLETWQVYRGLLPEPEREDSRPWPGRVR